MTQSLYIFDPTAHDAASKVRGIGRFMAVLKEGLPQANFTATLSSVPHDGVLINPYINLIGANAITKRYAKKQIGVIHDLVPLKFPAHFPLGVRGWLQVLKNRLQLGSYDHFVCVSDEVKQDVVRMLRIPPEKITVIYSFVIAELREAAKPSHPSEPYVLYAGDATWNKNVVAMAKAVMEAGVLCICVGKTFADYRANPAVLTHPWQQELRTFLELTANHKLFQFPGYVSNDELKTYYSCAEANLLVSRDEGFGFAFIEAAAQRTPSILSDIPVFHETAQQAALFVDQTNPSSIAQGIKTLAHNRHYRAELGSAAFARGAFFSVDRFRQAWESLCAQ